MSQNEKKYQILLITNRDWDNLGDQVVELCDLGLISVVMDNLNILNYEINSQDASLFPKEYVKTGDASLLQYAEELIMQSDLIIFGGAPMFNFRYESFYGMTAAALELAEKHHKPVLFSAIGVEAYDGTNEKCQMLKKALNYPCVRQITTRDNYDSLCQYKERTELVIGKVADPAVYCGEMLRQFHSVKTENSKRIGIFILRASGFLDNKINLSVSAVKELWSSLIRRLEADGYECELITSGYFADEAFLHRLIRDGVVEERQCVFGMNTPEQIVEKISSYAGVISTRLHPSIISYSLGVPAVGIVWNPKVREFYTSIGYPERSISAEDIRADEVADCLEAAMTSGVEKQADYRFSIYQTLFEGIRKVLCPQSTVAMYSEEELLSRLPSYGQTSPEVLDAKVIRKFRKVYENYNASTRKNTDYKKQVEKLNQELNTEKEKRKKTEEKIQELKTRQQNQKEKIEHLKRENREKSEKIEMLEQSLTWIGKLKYKRKQSRAKRK